MCACVRTAVYIYIYICEFVSVLTSLCLPASMRAFMNAYWPAGLVAWLPARLLALFASFLSSPPLSLSLSPDFRVSVGVFLAAVAAVAFYFLSL